MKTRSQTRLLAQAQQHQIQSSDLTNPTHPVPKAADDCCGVEDNNGNDGRASDRHAALDFLYQTLGKKLEEGISLPGGEQRVQLTIPLDRRDALHAAAMLDSSERPSRYVRRRVYRCRAPVQRLPNQQNLNSCVPGQSDQPRHSLNAPVLNTCIAVKIIYLADGSSLENTLSYTQQVSCSTPLPVTASRKDGRIKRVLQLRADVQYIKELHRCGLSGLTASMTAADVCKTLFVDSCPAPLVCSDTTKDCGWLFPLEHKQGNLYIFQNEGGQFFLQVTIQSDQYSLRRTTNTAIVVLESLFDKQHTLQYRLPHFV